MKRSLKRYVTARAKSVLLALGLQVRRANCATSEVHLLRSVIKRLNISAVIDVGANVGDFATAVRAAGFSGRIISFEPCRAAAEAFSVRFADDQLITLFRMAAGRSNSKLQLNLSANSVSSSLLPMLSTHKLAAPASEYVGMETVDVIMLDEALGSVLSGDEKVLLKIDVQGYEKEVLSGATEVLKKCQVLWCELSLVSLYQGQPLWRELIDLVDAEGFQLWTIIPGFSDLTTGQTLQVDALFVRKSI
jgi:FkbM family methyltransferase